MMQEYAQFFCFEPLMIRLQIANELIMKCDTIVRHSKDPRILYTADIERAVLRRPSNEYEWVIFLF